MADSTIERKMILKEKNVSLIREDKHPGVMILLLAWPVLVENVLGEDRMRRMHVHFSKIQYTSGGEKKHLTFADSEYGPEFEPLADLLVQKNSSAHIICESDGTMDVDALAMKTMYQNALEATL